MLVFDIETGPLPTDEIKRLAPPFESKLKHPGEFSPADVKVGNLKNEVLIDAKITDARAKHEKAVKDFADAVEKEEADYWRDVIDRAALSAVTGRVLAIGYRGSKDCFIDHQYATWVQTEEMMLDRFWAKVSECLKSRRQIVGFNSNYFDVPFLYQRSIILSVDVPSAVFDGRWLSKTFVDLIDYWRLGNRQISNKLDTIAKAMGIGGKTEGITGKDFARLYGDETTRQQALDYLKQDVELTWQFACRVGLAA